MPFVVKTIHTLFLGLPALSITVNTGSGTHPSPNNANELPAYTKPSQPQTPELDIVSVAFARNDPDGHPSLTASFLPQPVNSRVAANNPTRTSTDVVLLMIFIKDLRTFSF
jgi:hypothetical protein